MPEITNNLRDKDGLIPLTTLEPDRHNPRVWSLKTSGVKLYVDPQALSVARLLASRPDLAAQARIMFREDEIHLKRARIFGIPFTKALEMTTQAHVGKIVKSIYKTEKSIGLSALGTCATLVTHVQRTDDHVQIEAWQITEFISETFYLHGLIDARSKFFTHFDGATMMCGEAEKGALFESGRKVKGTGYQKWFRLDGTISQTDAVTLARAYLPLEDLLAEYTQHTEETAIA